MGIVIKFKEWCGHQFVIPWYGKERFLCQLNKKQFLLFFRFGNMRRDIRILCRFEIWPPPAANHVLDDPVLRRTILTTESIGQDTFEAVDFILAGVEFASGDLK